MRTLPKPTIMQAVALQRLAAVRDTRPDWPSVLLAPISPPAEPTDARPKGDLEPEQTNDGPEA